MATIKFNYQREKKQNPYVGIVSYNHFNNDELYSDLIVRPENNLTETEHVECYPVPDYVEEKGRAQGYFPDSSVAYIRVLWKEFEPEKGKYNYAFIQDILDKARQNNQTVMFRLMPHTTREIEDVPEWLKKEVECPARPKGQRVKDTPTDPKFLDLFAKAIKEFANKFDNDPTLAFIDLSLPGAWGEGEDTDKFTEEQIKEFVDVYTDCFKKTLIIGQIKPWIVKYMNQKANVGWRADCIGRPDLTFERVPLKVAEMADVWKKGYVSCESYWWLGEWKRQGWDIDKIIDITLSWHISSFNAKSLPIPYEWKDKVEEWNAKMGYHFVIDSVELDNQVKVGEKVKLTLTVNNVGVAPIYHKLPLKIKLKKDSYEKVFVTDVDITNWSVGKSVENITIALPNDIEKGEYLLEIGIGGEDCPSVVFATDAKQDGEYSILTTIEIFEEKKMRLEDIDENFKSENVNEPDIEWHEINEKEFDIYGVYYSKEDKEYLRFPKEWARSFNEYVYYHANRTSGGRVKFQTNSPYVAIRVVGTYLDVGSKVSIDGTMGVSLYTDNYFVTSVYPKIDFIKDHEREDAVVFDGIYKVARPFEVGKTHDFTLYMPILNGIKTISIGIKKGSYLTNGKEYKHKKPIVFYGSSITMGSCASRAGNDYIPSVCRMLDSDYYNFGLSGQAKGQKEMAEFIASHDASIYVIDYDYNAPTPEYLRETHYPFYKHIREKRPNTPIVFMSEPNTDYNPKTEARLEVILETLERAKKEGDKNVYFINGNTLFDGELRDNCTNDRCHPNDFGFYRMTKAVYPTLDKLLNK